MNRSIPERATVLIVEEDARLREALSAAVDAPNLNIIRVQNETEALNCLGTQSIDVLIVPLRGTKTDGAKLLELARTLHEDIDVIVTVEPNVLDTEAAVKLMEHGANDFLTKPINTDKLRAVVHRVLRQRAILAENRALHQQLTHPSELLGFTGKSARMQAVYDLLIRYAASPNTTVLICGESGTGKEVAARALHFHSLRRKGPYVPFNCAGLPEPLIESELFGHEAGAFTGATSRRRGRFELAHKGTLVLDEIGEMSLPAQAKLLRVLEERQFERVGGERPIRVDVRIVAITNRDLAAEVRAGRFREDLYHRLRVATVTMPPLRERVEDIPLLVSVFIEQFRESTGRDVTGITPRALRVLERYSWPGNVRELKNAIETMVVVAQSPLLDVGDLPEWLWSYETGTSPGLLTVEKDARRRDGAGFETDKRNAIPIPVYAGMSWEEIERETIRATLSLTGGNKAEAARVLGIGRRTLFRKIKEYRL